jgi:hypothetical protein
MEKCPSCENSRLVAYLWYCHALKGPIHDQSCCATLRVVQHDWSCMVLIDFIVNGQNCVAQNNFAQHDWSCMGPFRKAIHLKGCASRIVWLLNFTWFQILFWYIVWISCACSVCGDFFSDLPFGYSYSESDCHMFRNVDCESTSSSLDRCTKSLHYVWSLYYAAIQTFLCRLDMCLICDRFT